MPSSIAQQDCMPSELTAAMAMVQRAQALGEKEMVVSAECMALHVAASVGIAHNLLPALESLHAELSLRTPEVCEHLGPLAQAETAITAALPCALPSTVLGDHVANALIQADHPTSLDTWVNLHEALRLTALALMNISTDLHLHQPARQDQAQCDALTMVCCRVMVNDLALNMGQASGQFKEQGFQPLVAHKLLQSIRLLADATTAFTEYFVRGITLNRERISHGLANSLMLVTSGSAPIN